MTFGYRYQILHPVHGWENNATTKQYAFDEARRLAAKNNQEYIVYDRLARKEAVREWRVKPGETEN